MRQQPARHPPFQFVGGSRSLDFVNTVGDRLEPRTRRDYLASPADLAEWLAAAGLVARPARPSSSTFRGALRLRELLYRLLAAAGKGRQPAPSDLDAFEQAVETAQARRKLAPSGGRLAWVWRPSSSLLHQALAAVVLDALEVLTSVGAGRIRQCGDTRCGWLFVDGSPGGRRRWCSMADCGNRAKARRHYARARRR